jgi:long-chain acyl-CoA synthetase
MQLNSMNLPEKKPVSLSSLDQPHPGRRRIGRIALGDLIHKAARRFGDAPAILDRDRVVSFDEMNAQGNRFANGLLQRGAGRGDRIGMLCVNSVDMVSAFTGIQKAGLVWVPINTGLAPTAVDQILEHAGISILVIDQALHANPLLRAVIDARELPCIVIGAAAGPQTPPTTLSFEAAIQGMPDALPEVDIGSDELVLIMYTSGTTGRQKGVMHSHASVYAALMSNLSEFGVHRHDVVSCLFPMFHVAQHAVSMSFWIGGAAIRLDRGFDADRLIDDIARHRLTVLVALPMMYSALLNHPRLSELDPSSLRLCIYAMAPMSQTMLTRLIDELCPNFALCSGQTEIYSITTMFKPEEQLRRFGPYWGISAYVNETAIMDEEGNLLEREQIGEIVHRGPNVMLGYYKDPEATRAAFAFGWHHTGDLGKFDSDGQLLFLDRKKDMIKSGGENVPSMKVEEALLRHPAVGNAAVVGLPHARWIEAVTAFVILKPGVDATVADLDAHCGTLLGSFERPKKIVVVDALPMTITGKIQKAELRAAYREAYAGFLVI